MGYIILTILIGVGVGSLSGLVGIGGGVVLVPVLLYIYHLNMHTAAGTSLSIVLPMSLVGALSHLQRGNVDVRLMVLLGLGAVAGSFFGAWAGSLLPGQTLKKIFALILLTISLYTLADAYGVRIPWLSRSQTAAMSVAASADTAGPQAPRASGGPSSGSGSATEASSRRGTPDENPPEADRS